MQLVKNFKALFDVQTLSVGHSLLPTHSLAVGGKEGVVVLDLIRSIMDQCVRRTGIVYCHSVRS